MHQVIHNIRQRPDHHKNRIILISAAVAVGILLLVWAAVGSGRKTKPDENFFQTFSQDLQNSKDTFPEDPLKASTQP
jgi:hypothetical protein